MKKINKQHQVFIICLCTLMLAWVSLPVRASGQKSKGGPLAAPKVEGLPVFIKLLTFARHNIAEGDYESAIENLNDAKKIHPNDPIMHELYGLAYDGDRDATNALKHFLIAGETYFKEGNMDKSWKMIGWLKTINSKNKGVLILEKKIRKKQLKLNQKRLEVKKK
jgi:tetratricopeptide (TPR) repeat protein